MIHGHIGVGAILAFSFYIAMLQAPFQMLGMLIMMGQRAAASAGRIYEILDEQPAMSMRPTPRISSSAVGDVRFDNVDFAYTEGGPLVLKNLSLHLQPG